MWAFYSSNKNARRITVRRAIFIEQRDVNGLQQEKHEMQKLQDFDQ